MTFYMAISCDCSANNSGKNSLLYILAGMLLKIIQQPIRPRDCCNQIGLGSPDEIMK